MPELIIRHRNKLYLSLTAFIGYIAGQLSADSTMEFLCKVFCDR